MGARSTKPDLTHTNNATPPMTIPSPLLNAPHPPTSTPPPTNTTPRPLSPSPSSPPSPEDPTNYFDMLPDALLIEIMHRLDPSLPLPYRHWQRERKQVVRHPVHCASVCKRWQHLSNHSITSISLRDTRTCSSPEDLAALATRIGRRFPNLLSFTVKSVSLSSSSFLLALAPETPKLRHLEVRSLRNVRYARAINLLWPDGLAAGQVSWPSSNGLADKWQDLRSLTLARAGEAKRIAPFRHLDSLKIESFRSLPRDVWDLSTLCKLELGYAYGLAAIPTMIRKLTRLEVLELRNCPMLTGLSDVLGSITTLKELGIHTCVALKALPESLAGLTRLEKCSLSTLPMVRRLPEGMDKWRALRKLEISACEMQRLPEGIGTLPLLQEMVILNCANLLSLPQSLGAAASLTHVRVRDCPQIHSNLTAIPQGVLRVLSIQRHRTQHH